MLAVGVQVVVRPNSLSPNESPKSPCGKFSRSWFIVDVMVGVISGEMRSFRVYPNPASDKLFVEGLEQGDEISIITILGITLEAFPAEDHRTEVSLEDLKPGMYFLRIRSEEQISSLKFYKR